MRKGISPIVAVVLLIAIAVIAAVGLYFWVGGIATQQPTPDTPKTMVTYAITCNTANTSSIKNATIMIANTSPPGSAAIVAGSLNTSDADYYFGGNGCPGSAVSPGGQTTCIIANYGSGDGTISVFGGSADNVAGAQLTC